MVLTNQFILSEIFVKPFVGIVHSFLTGLCSPGHTQGHNGSGISFLRLDMARMCRRMLRPLSGADQLLTHQTLYRSTNLISLAQSNQLALSTASPHDVLVADTLSLPHPLACFDFAICIAVIHHLSSTDRRVAAISAILDQLTGSAVGAGHAASAVKRSVPENGSETPCPVPDENLPRSPMPGHGPGQALIFVWALEQSSSRRGWKDGDEQDVLVPWVLKDKGKGSRAPTKKAMDIINDDGSKSDTQTAGFGLDEARKDQVFNRYYHLYRKGELENECKAAGGRVIANGYDKDNWWAIVEPGGRPG